MTKKETQKEKLKKLLARLPPYEMQNPKEKYVQVSDENTFYYAFNKCDDVVLANVERIFVKHDDLSAWIDIINGRIVCVDARLNTTCSHVVGAYLTVSKLKGKRSLKAALANAFKARVNEYKKEIEQRQSNLKAMQIALKKFILVEK